MRKGIIMSAHILLSSILFGYLLLCLASAIPYDAVREQIIESMDQLSAQLTYPKDSFSGRTIDNWSDSIMLLMSSYDGEESVFKEAADSYYIRVSGADPRESFIQTVNGGEGQRVSYSRYWHGYKVFLAPLLTVFNLKEIRWLQMLTQALMIVCLGMLIHKKLPKAALPYILLILLLTPTEIGNCLEHSSVFVIMLLSCIILLWNPRELLNGNNMIYLFLFSGILTAYFDFLTAPTITLTVPLALMCMTQEGEKQRIKYLLLCVIIWFIGYAGMWVGKWVIAFISRGKAFLDELFHQIEFRVSATDLEKESVSRLSVLTKNFRTLFDIPYVTVMICCYVGIMMGKAVKYHRRISYQRLETGLLLYIPALVSIGWILLLTNHSSIHYWFTHRTLAPAVFCLLCAMDVIPRHSLSTDQEVKPHAAHDTDAMPE